MPKHLPTSLLILIYAVALAAIIALGFYLDVVFHAWRDQLVEQLGW